jgi:hypothetical protein
MEMKFSQNAMLFEDEQFDRKRVLVMGEFFRGGFCIYENSLEWIEYDKNLEVTHRKEIEDDKKSEIISFIIAEAKKKNFEIITWESTNK